MIDVYKPCKLCGKDISHRGWRAKYCSDKCKYDHYYPARHGKPLPPVTMFQKVSKRRDSLEDILRRVAIAEGVDVIAIKGKSRKDEIAKARHIYCYLAKKQGYTLGQIGAAIGNRKHATALHSIKAVENMESTGELKQGWHLQYRIEQEFSNVVELLPNYENGLTNPKRKHRTAI